MEELMADNILVIVFPHVKGRVKQGGSIGTDIAKNTVVSCNFLVWKFCGKAQFPHSFVRPKLCRNCAFPQNFHTRKLGETAVFFAVELLKLIVSLS